MADKIEIPNPPAHLPAVLQKKWSATYETAYKQAQIDQPNDANAHKQAARIEANKLMRIPAPESHKEAAALVSAFEEQTGEGWKVLGHGKRKIGGVDHLVVITADAKKHAFPIPAK